MEINLPDLPPLPVEKKPEPADQKVTIGQTGNAQIQTTFGSVADELVFNLKKGGYDENAAAAVEKYITLNNLPSSLATHMRIFGSTNMDDYRRAVNFVTSRQRAQYAMENSSLGAQLITDPTIPVSIFLPYAAINATKLLPQALNLLSQSGVKGINRYGQLRAIARSREIMRGGLTREEMTKLFALDGAVSSGAMTFPEALSQAGIDPEQGLTDLLNAAILTASVTSLSAGIGYTLSSLLPKSLRQREKEIKKEYREYLRSTSETPLKDGEDVSFTGKWFTESWFMKFVPTPVREVIQSKAYDDFLKMEILTLAGDNGMPLVMNQLGKSAGTSVYTNSGRRAGEWFNTLDKLDNTYNEIMSKEGRGDIQFSNVEIRNAIEKIRGKIGLENFTKQQWYNHIGRLYVDEVPMDKLTDQEARSVTALESFFENYRKEMEDLGLINSRDLFETRFLEAAGRKAELISVTNSIIAQNRKWMKETQDKLFPRMSKLGDKWAKLAETQRTRGLTNKQLILLDNVKKEWMELSKQIGEFGDARTMLDYARNMDDLFALRNKLNLTPSMRQAMGTLSKSIDDLTEQLDNMKAYLDAVDSGPRPRYLPRFFNRQAIAQNRDEFRRILMNWYKNNPQIRSIENGKVVVRELSTSPEDVFKRAESTINGIMEETEEEAIEAIFSGYGRSKHFMERTLDIPNSEIKDFIVTDVKELMIAYTNRVAPKIEYHKKFADPESGGLQTLEARLDYYRDYMKKKGYSEKDINKYIKNFVHSYDRVVGTTLKRADAIDTKLADMLRSVTSWTFLGSSGVAAVGDLSTLFMDHELETIGKAFLSILDQNTPAFAMGKRETKLAGQSLEITMGTTHLRYMESLSNDMFGKGTFDKLNNAFYILNGLSLVTTSAKSLDGLVRGHTIVEASIRLTKNKASKFEREFLARYNVTPELAARIAEMPVEKTNQGLYLANTEAWTDKTVVEGFRNALHSGIMNRIIMGTPADKPIMMDGVAYVPIKLGKQFGLKEDSRVRGYARVESGLLALPFTFYSYTMGALSKITANYASGTVRNPMAHIAVAMGLGSMIVRMRTPSYVWNDMDPEDKIARSFDFSGLAAIYTDLTYRGLSMAYEFGIANDTFIAPKFKAQPDAIGALLSLGGAPADWTYGVAQAIGDMLQGNMSDGAKGLVRHTPIINAYAFQGLLKDTAMDIAGSLPNRP
tara:strand:+ start:4301 stop:7894 length:3594 start_codon:yes stop_codon:yes gene_type:complete